MPSRFVRPDTTTLRISQGDTLTVKRRLNAGEQRALFARMYIATVEGALKVNPLQSGLSLVLAYLIDWSLVDADGTRVAILDRPLVDVTATLDALDPDAFGEIKDAIEAHDDAVREARSIEKKRPAGETPSPSISPSPDAVAGATSGSPS